MNERIKPIVMPKWGLSMAEGKVTGWLKPAGTQVKIGDELLEVETEKIAGVVEAGDAGTLRRVVAEADTVYPIKALLGVLADDDVSDADIDAFVAGYVTPAGDDEDGEDTGPRYEFIETPAGRLRYAKRGDGGASVVLIHGFGGDLDNWLFNIDALAASNTVYALDLPGHGQSSKAIANPTLQGMSDALLGFMDALDIGKAHLVGHSMGGAIGLLTAKEHPERVASLTLIASAGLGDDINDGYISGFVTATSRRDLKPVLEQLFEDPSLVSRQLVDDVLKYKRIDGVDAALSALSGNIFPHGRQSQSLATAGPLPPTLVIWGAGDRVVPASHARSLQAARVEVIEGAGHMVQMEKANRVNELVVGHIGS